MKKDNLPKKETSRISYQITRDGSKNVVVVVQGKVVDSQEAVEVLKVGDVTNNPVAYKLDQVVFAVEKDVKVQVGWSKDGAFLPVEGRGLLNYYSFDSLHANTPGQSLTISASGTGLFHIVLDCTKVERWHNG